MKKSTLLLLTIFISSQIYFSQSVCDNGRYITSLFSNYTKTSDIQFGQNNSFTGANYNLRMDVYEPTGDTMAFRPLIIWAHGGSFLGGDKGDSDVAALCQRFTKRGFVCASVNYRTGFFPIDSANAVKAVVRAVQDMKASIRFFYKDRKDGINDYGIDTNNIFIGGSSAGAITALHIAYLDSTCKISDYLNNTMITNLQGLEGNSGNPCYSTKVHGVLNGAGALARYAWIEATHPPLCSVHGTNDNVVKYSRGVVNPGVPLMYLDGSRMLHEHANNIGLTNEFYTFNGVGHVPYALSTAHMNTTENFYTDFLAQRLGCPNPGLQAANAPSGTAPLYTVTPCSGHLDINFCNGSNVEEIEQNNIHVFPNPIKNEMYISIKNWSNFSVKISTIDGRAIKTYNALNQNEISLKDLNLSSGNYLLKFENKNNGQLIIKKIIIE